MANSAAKSGFSRLRAEPSEEPMSKKIKRRQFLAGIAAAPAASIAATTAAKAAAAQTQPAPQGSSLPAAPQERSLNDMPPQTSGKTGSDFMVDVLKTLDIDYIASC